MVDTAVGHQWAALSEAWPMLTCPALSSHSINHERRRISLLRRRRPCPKIFYPASTRHKWNKFDDGCDGNMTRGDFKRPARLRCRCSTGSRAGSDTRRHAENYGAQRSVTGTDGLETTERCAAADCTIEVVIGFDGRRSLHPRNYAKRFRANAADLIYSAALLLSWRRRRRWQYDDAGAAADCLTSWEIHQSARLMSDKRRLWVVRQEAISQIVQLQFDWKSSISPPNKNTLIFTIWQHRNRNVTLFYWSICRFIIRVVDEQI